MNKFLFLTLALACLPLSSFAQEASKERTLAAGTSLISGATAVGIQKRSGSKFLYNAAEEMELNKSDTPGKLSPKQIDKIASQAAGGKVIIKVENEAMDVMAEKTILKSPTKGVIKETLKAIQKNISYDDFNFIKSIERVDNTFTINMIKRSQPIVKILTGLSAMSGSFALFADSDEKKPEASLFNGNRSPAVKPIHTGIEARTLESGEQANGGRGGRQ